VVLFFSIGTTTRAEWPSAAAARLQTHVSCSVSIQSILSDHGLNPHPSMSQSGVPQWSLKMASFLSPLDFPVRARRNTVKWIQGSVQSGKSRSNQRWKAYGKC
jgi:hypothetical protein